MPFPTGRPGYIKITDDFLLDGFKLHLIIVRFVLAGKAHEQALYLGLVLPLAVRTDRLKTVQPVFNFRQYLLELIHTGIRIFLTLFYIQFRLEFFGVMGDVRAERAWRLRFKI